MLYTQGRKCKENLRNQTILHQHTLINPELCNLMTQFSLTETEIEIYSTKIYVWYSLCNILCMDLIVLCK